MKTLKRTILWSGIFLLSGLAFLYFINTQSMLRWAVSQVVTDEPGGLAIGNIQGRFFGPIHLDEIRFEYEDTRYHVAQIEIQWQPAALLYGRLHITLLDISDVQITQAADAGDLGATLDNLAKSLPSFPIDITSGIIRKLSIRDLQTTQLDVLDEITLSGNTRLNKITLDELNVLTPTYSVAASGSVSPKPNLKLDAVVEWDWHPVDGKRLLAKAKLHGDARLLHVNTSIDHPGRLQFTGEIENVMTDLKWHGTLKIHQFDYATYFKALELDSFAPGPLSGEGQINGDLENIGIKGNFVTSLENIGTINSQLDIRLAGNSLHIQQAAITQADSSTKVQIQGLLLFADDSWLFDGKTQWQDIQWPLSGPAEFVSPAGEISGQLTENDYALALRQIIVQYGGHTLSDLSATAEGNYLGLEFTGLNGRALDGTINGSGKINWESGLSWQTWLQGGQINPGHLHAQWPGELSIELNSQGNVVGNDINAQVQIDSSKGRLKGQAFSGQGALQINNDTYSSTGLNIISGDTLLKLAGSVGSHLNLNWDLKHADIALLYADTEGQFSSKGTITGTRHNPLIRAQLIATGVENDQKQKIETISVDMNMDLSGNKDSTLAITVDGLQYQDSRLDNVRLTAIGKPKNHQLKFTAKADQDTLSAKLTGAYADEQWQGEISEASLHTELAGDWKILSGASLKVSQRLFELIDSCWVNNKARWCASSHWQKDQSIASRFKFERVPLSLFQPLVKNQFQFKGELNGHAELHIKEHKIHNANVDLSVSEGSINMMVDKQLSQVSSFQQGALTYTQTWNQINGNVALHFSEQESLTAAIKLSPPDDSSTAIRDWPVAGYLKANIQHPDFVRLFYPAIHDITGIWRSDIQLGGSIANPMISGYTSVIAPLISLPAAGLVFKDTNLSINSIGENNFEISGGFLSGNGSVDIDGHLLADPQQGWPVQIKLTGEQLQVYKVEESEVEISPDLEIKIAAERVDINGHIEISKAHIVTEASLSESIKISNDVVFVGESDSGENSKAGMAQDQAGRLKVYSKVKFTLSDNVYFDGYGLNGRLIGSVDVEDEPGKTATGQGALHIKEGRFKALGVSLDLDIGRLIFDNDPVDNPAINARASKRSGDITAGVRITGYLTAPDVSVYSIPSMPENEVISYLLFGKLVNDTSFGSDSFNSGGGQPGGSGGGLSLGDALNPGQYIDYAVGLLSSTSVLKIRFEINKNWEVNTESSATHRGAELVYTFER